MIKNKQHPHASIIAEWVKNPTRKLEGCGDGLRWMNAGIGLVVDDIEGTLVFRFLDTVEQKHKIISSLTDEELFKIADNGNSYKEDINCAINRLIADAGARRAIEDLEPPGYLWLAENLTNASDMLPYFYLLEKYLAAVKAGKSLKNRKE